VLVEEHFGLRAYHQSRRLRESRVGDTSHPFLLHDIRHHTLKPQSGSTQGSRVDAVHTRNSLISHQAPDPFDHEVSLA